MKEMKKAEEYHIDILQQILDEMNASPWYIKLWREIKVWQWIAYCHIFNNKYVRRWKKVN